MLVLFAVTLLLRFYRFQHTYDWGADNARDFLVAKHIVRYQDWKWIAPWSFGSNNLLANSGIYYYFLAIFYLFSFDHVLIYQYIIAIFCLITTFVYGYLLGKLFFQHPVARWLTATIISILPVFNLYGRSVFQPHFALIFFLIFTYYLLLALRKQSAKYLLLANVVYFFSLNFHFSLLILYPWMAIMNGYIQLKIYQKQHKKSRLTFKEFVWSQATYTTLVLILSLYFLVLNQIVIYGWQAGSRMLGIFLNKLLIWQFTSDVPMNVSFVTSLRDNFATFPKILFGLNQEFMAIIGLFLLFFIVLILWFQVGEQQRIQISLICLSFLFFPLIFILIKLPNELPYPYYYFTPYYVLLPIGLFMLLSGLSKKWQLLGVGLFFLLTFLLSVQQLQTFQVTSNHGYRERQMMIAEQIYADLKHRNAVDKGDFSIFTIDDQLDWNSSIYWYLLEDKLDKPLIQTTAYRYNIISLYEHTQFIYLVCDDPRVSWDVGREKLCLERFSQNRNLENADLIFIDESRNIQVYLLFFVTPVSQDALLRQAYL